MYSIPARMVLQKSFIFLGVMLTLMSTFTLSAQAQPPSYTYGSYNYCRSPIDGYSEIAWNGYPSTTNGTTTGTLWWWDGSAWIAKDSDYISNTGSNIIAGGPTSSPYVSGYWVQTGSHTATFLGGPINSSGTVALC